MKEDRREMMTGDKQEQTAKGMSGTLPRVPMANPTDIPNPFSFATSTQELQKWK